jgi:excisionase family DNA binding protein
MERMTMSVPEAAILLGIGRTSAYEAARKGEIGGVPVIRVGGRIRIPTAKLADLLGVPPEVLVLGETRHAAAPFFEGAEDRG